MEEVSEIKEIIEKLRELGFTEYEARAYTALLLLGEGKAEEISRKARIPLPRVYSTLESLKERGFIQILESRPKRYCLIDPKKAISRYIEMRRKALEEELKREERRWYDLLRRIIPYYEASRYEIKPGKLLESLKDLDEALSKTVELIEAAEREILIMSHTFTWFEKVKNELTEAVKRGVEVKVLMSINPLTEDRVRELRKINVEVRNHPAGWYPVRCTISDGSRAVMVIWASTQGKGGRRVYRPSYTENEGLICLLKDVFKFYWSMAKS